MAYRAAEQGLVNGWRLTHDVRVCHFQGFTREITLPRERWVGYIKDYDGGTLMECIIYPKLPYTDLVTAIRVRLALLACCQRISC